MPAPVTRKPPDSAGYAGDPAGPASLSDRPVTRGALEDAGAPLAGPAGDVHCPPALGPPGRSGCRPTRDEHRASRAPGEAARIALELSCPERGDRAPSLSRRDDPARRGQPFGFSASKVPAGPSPARDYRMPGAEAGRPEPPSPSVGGVAVGLTSLFVPQGGPGAGGRRGNLAAESEMAMTRACEVWVETRCEDSCEDSCEVGGEDSSQAGERDRCGTRRRNSPGARRKPALSCGGDVLVTQVNLAAGRGDVLVTPLGEDPRRGVRRVRRQILGQAPIVGRGGPPATGSSRPDVCPGRKEEPWPCAWCPTIWDLRASSRWC